MPRVFELTMTRQGPLMVFEAWIRGSNTSCLRLGMPKGDMPFEFLVNRNGFVADYIEPRIDDAYCEKVLEHVKKSDTYLDEVFAEYEPILQRILETERDGSVPEDLRAFAEEVMLGWHGLLVAYMTPGFQGMPQAAQEQALAMRRKGEAFFDASSRIFERILAARYPHLALRNYLSLEDVLSGNIPSSEILEHRKSFYFLSDEVLYEGGLEDYLDQCDVCLHDNVAAEKNIHRFRGVVACSGTAEGIVHVLTSKDEIPSFQEGKILVASMTTPDYLPAAQKALAIITDEGGITCHAAIVARELGKPCVIGTKIATKVLKNGDRVEMNIENGLVRVLSR